MLSFLLPSHVCIQTHRAHSSVLTHAQRTLVDVFLAVRARVPRRARTVVSGTSHDVMASRVVLTRRGHAVVHVHFAVVAKESLRALAGVAPGAGLGGGGGPWRLDADEGGDTVGAGAAILAR